MEGTLGQLVGTCARQRRCRTGWEEGRVASSTSGVSRAAAADDEAVSYVRVAAGDLDTLRGRILDADDDFDDLIARGAELRALDARTLRVRTFGAHDPLER